MKKILILFTIFQIIIQQAQCNDIVYTLDGEYKIIANNIQESMKFFQILDGKIDGDKAKAALAVEQNLKSQIPLAILALGNYYLVHKNFEKATLYHRLSMFRAAVDIRASHDESLDDVFPQLYLKINEACKNLTSEQRDSYMTHLKNVTKHIIAIDQEIPRDYDIRWASLHSIKTFTKAPLNYAHGKDLENIIEQERKSYIEAAKLGNIWQ